MRIQDIKQFVEGTSDPAFAANCSGLITAWNASATELFGTTKDEAIGKDCGDILQGFDECGAVCSPECTVRQAAKKHHPVRNFDLHVETAKGKKWCNLSVIIVDEVNSALPYTIHILRLIDVRKRLEVLVRDFVVSETSLPEENVLQMISATRSAIRETDLTKRELEILKLAAKGATSSAIAKELNISSTTVDNHFQHILKKLNAHSRLGAIRKAEIAKLI